VKTLPWYVLAGRSFVTLPDFFSSMTREHGPVVCFRNFRRRIYLITEPSLVEEVLVAKGPAFMKGRGTQRLARLLGRGLLTLEQPEHLRHRRMIQPAFHRKRIDAYATIMVGETLARLGRWSDGETVDVEHETNRLALDIVAKSLFGSDLSRDMDDISDALNAALQTFPAAMLPFAELFDNVPVPNTLRLRAAKKRLWSVVDRMIREHRAGAGDPDDVLSMLLEARDDSGGGALSDEAIRDEALTILLAGHETTANAMAWAFYLLDRDPAICARLYAHVDEVLGDRPATAADVPRLDFVRAVFAETMRLYPPAWVTARRALEPVEIGPHRLARGDIAIVSQYVSHRDPRFFSEPERFDPDRWSGPPPPKFAYFPFGGGNRLCIGEQFAWMEGILVLATIAQRARLARAGAAEVATLPLVTLRPRTPIRARVEFRSRSLELA
jgi:cytochrome P450